MNTKKTHGHNTVDSSLFEEVVRLYKGSGKTLGELAALTRGIRSELNAWYSGLEIAEIQATIELLAYEKHIPENEIIAELIADAVD